jgi:AraC family transcriptional regulator
VIEHSSFVGILPAGIPYRAGGTASYRALAVSLEPSLLRLGPQRQSVELIPGYGFQDPFLQSACLALLQDVREHQPHGAIYGESLVAALAGHLVRRHSTRPDSVTQSQASQRRKELVREYIHDHIGAELTLADLAAVAALNIYSFIRWFVKTFGMPPHRYLLHLRLEMAKSLLATTHAPILEIAARCGFTSASHFSNTFRAAVGMPPVAYRRRARGEDLRGV